LGFYFVKATSEKLATRDIASSVISKAGSGDMSKTDIRMFQSKDGSEISV
jgi:hypothetical protein